MMGSPRPARITDARVALPETWVQDGEIRSRIIVFLLTLSLLSVGLQPAEATFGTEPDRLVVAIDRPRNDLWVVDRRDGHLIRRLTNTRRLDEYPGGWAPHGGWFVFARGRPGDCDLYLRSSRTGRVSVFQHNVANEYSPAWSPDGRSIAFIQSGGGFDPVVEVARRDGTVVRTLPFPVGTMYGLIWSTRDQVAVHVASSLDPEGDTGVWVVRADGLHLRRIPGSKEWTPMDWSPDGRWLLASRPAPRDDRKEQLIRVHADGTDRRVLFSAVAIYAARFQPHSKAVLVNAPSEPLPRWVWVYKVPLTGGRARLLVSLEGDASLDTQSCF